MTTEIFIGILVILSCPIIVGIAIGLRGTILQYLLEIGRHGALEKKQATLVWGTVLLVSRTLLLMAVASFLSWWPLDYVAAELAILASSMFCAGAWAVRVRGKKRMIDSMQMGGYGPGYLSTSGD